MIKKIIKKLIIAIGGFHLFEQKIFLQGKILSEINNKKKKIKDLSDVEFSVFSQWGDDGIIDWILNSIKTKNKIFLEIGTGDYKESNTRFLLKKRNWKGYIFEGEKKFISEIKNQSIYWMHDLKAFNFFIKKNNINKLLQKINIKKNIGLLSLDIDGNDYWIWKEINKISPDIFVCEYNSVFGDLNEISVLYKDNFNRTKAHYSNLVYGASINAMIKLSKKKGYEFIGTNANGINAYFVKKKYLAKLNKKIKLKKKYSSIIKESRDLDGTKSFISGTDRYALIKNIKVLDLKDKKIKKLSKFKKIYSKDWQTKQN